MNILKLWAERGKIIEGIKNSIFKREDVEAIAEERDQICKSNQCGYYDEAGISERCYIPGKRCCSACGCNLDWKQRSLSSSCGLTAVGKEPLWKAVLTEAEEDKLREKLGMEE